MATPVAHDVIILGAGFAGLSAAESLLKADVSVHVLEAADRPGGRVWRRKLANSEVAVDWGAEWVIPALHQLLMVEAAKLNLTLDRSVHAAPVRWELPERVYGTHEDIKVTNPGFATALRQIESDADAWEKTLPTLVPPETSLTDYFNKVTNSKTDQALLACAFFPLTGADPATVSARMVWAEIGFHGGSIDGTLDADSYRFVEGAGRIGEAMAERLSNAITYNAQVASLEDHGTHVSVLAAGKTFTAQRCICALPLRTLDQVKFSPPLAVELRDVAEHSNAGRVAKIWAMCTAPRLPDTVMSLRGPIHYGYARPVGDHQFMMSAQMLSDAGSPVGPREARTAFRHHWPELEIQEIEVADWPNKPLARASWQTGRAGWTGRVQQFQEPAGNIHFAGGDVAKQWAGWMEGALISGRDAAQHFLELQ